MAKEVRIPNWSTLSTLVDRLSIENVKLAHFENAIEHDNPPKEALADLQRKTDTQHQVIEALKRELANLLEEIFSTGIYQYMKEERTFS